MFQLIALPDLSSPVATGSDGVKLQGRAPERASKWISRRYGHIVDGNNANLSYRRTREGTRSGQGSCYRELQGSYQGHVLGFLSLAAEALID
jgi:hypothetical protein